MKNIALAIASVALVGYGAPAFAQCCAPVDGQMVLASAEEHGDHAAEAAPAATPVDIVDTAMANADFSTLVTALKAAELVDALKAEGPFTVFAPTNAAFAALPAGTLDDLLKPENKEKLQGILKYHVVSGKVMAADIAEGSTDVATLQGANVAVAKNAEGVTVGGAKVTGADVAATNGVIHVIDTVIMPPEAAAH
jgi:uncharacterized surface protein with fasciclin (FAS1) repeats